MGSLYKENEIEAIDEGRFLQQINAILRKVQRQLVEYRHKHGDQADGKKATVSAHIEIICVPKMEDSFTLQSFVTNKFPAEPKRLTRAHSEETQTGELTLFVKNSGSSSSNSKQQQFFTDDGRKINPTTGEVLGEAEDVEAENESTENDD